MPGWMAIVLMVLGATGGMSVAWLVARLLQPSDAERQAGEAQFARETLSRLQDLTRKVKADVDQHSSCVEEISAQLSQSVESDEGSVLSAVSDLIEANRRMQRQLNSAEERLQAQARQIESHAVEAQIGRAHV